MLRSVGQHSDDRPQPTLHAVEDLAAASRGAGMRVTVDDRVVDAHALPPAVGRHVHRVVQEALTNARKHAPGGDVRVVRTGTPTVGVTVIVLTTFDTDDHVRRALRAGAQRLPARARGAARHRTRDPTGATVKAYMSRILRRLGCTNRVQVALLVHDARRR